MAHSPIKEPLYRKVNTKARGIRHHFGGDFRDVRNAKRETREQVFGSMHGNKQRGLDYTPLYRFLISKIGCNWDEVFREAASRIDKPDPIFWLVAMREDQKNEMVRVEENSYYTGLYIDESGLLQIVNPELKAEDLAPYCTCCTHTLNGIPFGKTIMKNDDNGESLMSQ